jgi:outer membrane protease
MDPDEVLRWARVKQHWIIDLEGVLGPSSGDKISDWITKDSMKQNFRQHSQKHQTKLNYLQNLKTVKAFIIKGYILPIGIIYRGYQRRLIVTMV